MAKQTHCPPADSVYEMDFRRKSRWFAFKAALYTAFGTATFFGVVSQAMSIAFASAAATAGAAGLTVATGGLMAVMLGFAALCIYNAQYQLTELRCIQDERLARKQAEMLVGTPANDLGVAHSIISPVPAQEYDNPARKDGKSWQSAVKTPVLQLAKSK